ncbi:MAG: 3-deoxy-8-phosphooctulonate synthase [Deltaproteobacteria bacterium]|nr:MAG: 3-deoxy-8-phosphooctulonate synthase [Deltaproteobacteria bacterium]
MTREVIVDCGSSGKQVKIGGDNPLILIAGPCVIENEEITLKSAEFLRKLTEELKLPFVFKSSYDKANRSSLNSYRGPGLEKGLRILKKVKEKTLVPILADIHSPEEVKLASEVLDVIQIPAFLCRQTDLLIRAAETGKVINIKKGQFMAPNDMDNVVKKVASTGNHRLLLCERGVSFGYNNLIADMRSLVIMRDFGYPVVFDATHSLQLPGGEGTYSGGQREFVPHLARAAAGVGIDGLFLEVHPDPDQALCDGANMLKLDSLAGLLKEVKKIDEIVKKPR